ncbi:MAG: hypothetical protein HOP34_00215 [Methylococcaceae bacterium]|nr:hypothetical protein [Methylococcaceae bacterium]
MMAKFWPSRRGLRHRHAGTALAVQVAFVRMFIGTVVLGFLLVGLHGYLPQAEPPQAGLLIASIRANIAPEPTERFVFLALALTVPLIAFVTAVVSTTAQNRAHWHSLSQNPTFARILPLLVALLLFVPLLGSDFLLFFAGDNNATPYQTLALCSAVSLLLCAQTTSGQPWRLPNQNVQHTLAWGLFLACVLLQIVSWRLLGIHSVTHAGKWTVHADAVFYPLSQVVAGKTLLVDLPSQYGLWPEMLAPLFRSIGLSVLGLTSVFACLQLGSLSALFLVLSKQVKTFWLRIIGGLALIVMTFGTGVLFSDWYPHDPYFQYGPIRFVWPALSVLALYHYSSAKTLLRSTLLSLIAALGLLWNLDSGLCIVLAYGAFLAARLAVLQCLKYRGQTQLEPHIRHTLAALAIHLGMVLGVAAIAGVALTLKSGQALQLAWLFEYQKIFYGLGYMMMPMPMQLDPWMSVLGIYLLGLLVSLHAWLHNPAYHKMDSVFYLSLLGLGAFAYYQGRSHFLCLTAACWPALLIIIILADTSLRTIKARLVPVSQLYLPVVAVSFLGVCVSSFASYSPLFFKNAARAYESRLHANEALVADELAFIRQYGSSQHECLILSALQGIYYAESGLASPLKGPGIVELALTTDQQQLFDSVLQGDLPCLFLNTEAGNLLDPQMLQMMQLARSQYTLVATSPMHTLQYLKAKQP